MTACLSDESVLDFLERRAPVAVLDVMQAHLGACEACMELVTITAGSYWAEHSPPELPASPTPTLELASRPELLTRAEEPLFLSLPATVNEFQVLKPLGRGAMGQVYIGHDMLLDRRVAIKFLSTDDSGSAARERLLVEARAIARLMHPNVVAIYTVGEYAGHPYLVSELVRGQSLDKLDKPLPWEHVHRIGLNLARGLAAAHRQGIVHRDLKPANAILSDEGAVKLLDFGLAKLRRSGWSEDPNAKGAASDKSARTLSWSVGASAIDREIVGTPLYMSPEVWLGLAASPLADIYSLGVLLYELCTGTLPHLGASLDELRHHVLHEAPIPIYSRGAHVDRSLAEAIMRCLQTDADARFPSADELLRALSQIRPRVTAAIPQGNPYRGLAAFQAEHQALFFGRESDIESALDRLRTEPLLVLAGDSGVGKSSLCYAGVLPGATDGDFIEGRQFSAVAVLPGKEPLRALALALEPHLGHSAGEVLALAQSAPADVPRLLQERLGSHSGLLLFIDQMEELLTQSQAAEAAQTSKLLAQLAGRWPGIRILASVRGDFLTRAAALPGLGSLVVAHLQFVLPLLPESLRTVVSEPAHRKGFAFDPPELVDQIAESLHSDGGLPLLQFALAQLWEQRDVQRRVISAQALERIGGVTGALTCHADRVLASLLPAQQIAARRLLCKLVTAQDTRLRRRESELRTADVAELPALEALLRGRLLIARGGGEDSEYELAHEALIRDWPQLRSWLTSEGERRLIRQRMEEAAREWDRLGRTRESLWSDAQLRELQAVRIDPDSLGEREQQFLAATTAAQLRRRRLRLALLMILPMVAVSIGFLGLLSHRSRREASQAQQFARHTQESAQRESGLRAYALALQSGREREALLGAIKSAELSRREGEDTVQLTIQPAVLAALRAAVQVGRQSMPLTGHRTAARWAAFSSDGTRVVTGDESEEARLWETETGRLLSVSEHRSKFSYRIFFSPDDRYVIVPLLSGVTQLWDAHQGGLVATLNGHTGPVSHTAISPDGRFLATATGMSYLAKPDILIWELRTQRLVRSFHAHDSRIEWVEYSPDGRFLLSASWDHTARLFESQSGRLVAILRGHKDQVDLARFSPDGTRVLTICGDGTARLWAAPSGSLLFELRGHTGLLTYGTFSRDGKHVLTSSLDGTAKVWNALTGALQHTLTLHSAPVRTAVATADSLRIVTAGDDETVRIWSMQTGQELAVLRGHSQQVVFAFLSRDDKYIVSGDMNGAIRLWSGDSGKHLNILRGSLEYDGANFSGDGRFLVTNGALTLAQQVWDGKSGFPIARLAGHTAPSTLMGVSPDGDFILTRGVKPPDTTLRLWHTQSGEQIALLNGSPGTLNTVDISRDSQWILSANGAGTDHTARIFDGHSGRTLYTHPLHFSDPWAAAFSPDKRYIAVAYAGGGLEVLDAKSGRERLQAAFPGAKSAVVCFSPDGKWLAMGGKDGQLHTWQVEGFTAAPTLPTGPWIRVLAYSPDSRWLATEHESAAVIVDVAAARIHGKFEHPKESAAEQPFEITDIGFASDSRRFLTASYDRTARIWDVVDNKLLVTLRGHSAFVNSAVFSPDGSHVATASGDGTVRVWDAHSGSLAPLPVPATLLQPIKPLAESTEDQRPSPQDSGEARTLLALACRLLRYQPEFAQVESTCRDYLVEPGKDAAGLP